MTDRQTNSRSGCWSITIFNEEEIHKIQDKENLPEFIREVYGQMEKCKTSGREHFQGCLITKYCRFSQIKKFLPTTHIEKAIQKEALIKYVKKSDTKIGDDVEIVNERPYYSLEMTMKLMGETYLNMDRRKLCHYSQYNGDNYQGLGVVYPFKEVNYWIIVREILRERSYLCSVLSNPQTYRLWVNTYQVWIGE